MAFCFGGPASCAVGAGITGLQALGAAAAAGVGAIILNARPPQNPEPLTNPPQLPPAIPENWVSSPTQSGGGTIYYPPGQNPPDSGEAAITARRLTIRPTTTGFNASATRTISSR